MLKIIILVVLMLIQTEQPGAPIITAENIERLVPVAAAAFDQPQVSAVDSGWFALSPDGQYAAVVSRDGSLVIFEDTGEIADQFRPDTAGSAALTVLDADFAEEGQLAAVYTDGIRYVVAVHTVNGDTITIAYPDDAGRPVRVWLETPYVWLETAPDVDFEAGYRVVRLPLPNAPENAILVQPSAPEADRASFVRIGRIPAPLAITSTPEGLVKLWHLETGALTATVQLDVPPVFGRVNETTGMQMAWRDPASQTLHLLDFSSGTDVQVATLDGDYIQAIMVTPGADVILAVHIGDAPVVAAWDVASGQRHDLGRYGACGRVPDLVLLSQDGTTLVIGCDTGLEFWRVASD